MGQKSKIVKDDLAFLEWEKRMIAQIFASTTRVEKLLAQILAAEKAGLESLVNVANSQAQVAAAVAASQDLSQKLYDRLGQISDTLDKVLKVLSPEKKLATELRISINGKEVVKGMATQVKDNGSAVVTLAPLDVDKFPTTLASPPTVVPSDPTLFTLAVDTTVPGGLQWTLTPTGTKLGIGQVQVSGDPGGGAPPIQGVADVEIIASAAATFGIAVTPK